MGKEELDEIINGGQIARVGDWISRVLAKSVFSRARTGSKDNSLLKTGLRRACLKFGQGASFSGAPWTLFTVK